LKKGYLQVLSSSAGGRKIALRDEAATTVFRHRDYM
jgi:hypothetical protein